MEPRHPTQTPTQNSLLGLPTELRLLIYSFVLLDAPAITISAAQLVGPHHAIIHRLYRCGLSPYPGIPRGHEPVVEAGYHPDLLSAADPPIIPVTSADEDPLSSYADAYTAHHNLLLVNRQIHAELTGYFASNPAAQHRRSSNLFVQYPHGLHIFRTLTPHLMRQARTIHLAGIYRPTNFSEFHRATILPPSLPASVQSYADWTPNSTTQLRHLCQRTVGDDAAHPIAKFEMRIYFPGADSYSMAWCDDNSPLVVALREIGPFHIGIECWRGRAGTGIYLSATPRPADAPDVERKGRCVATAWRKLQEGGRGQPKEGSWVVDPKWPGWEDGRFPHEGFDQGSPSSAQGEARGSASAA